MRRSGGGEEGSEVVATVLLQGLVLVVVLAMLQIGFALHTRNLAISAAQEGARRGGLLGGDEAEAVARTREILSSFVGADEDPRIEAVRSTLGGREVLVVTVETAVPVVGALGPRWLTVVGRSLVERGLP
ncbi:pilus assembly protein [Actinomyces sp. B33]|uniref:TadE/TadG family type IV pilus assembly protein n=1 Tax=Actinomyces sp. B33 TaxID=2942131 RepID=UPI002341B694|nr:TadE/TadG family type IV pilus assembly protein [Actinomyces sp. B33]MDC4233801.1 pilus assembly protein [Actinomyces sp. B33]